MISLTWVKCVGAQGENHWCSLEKLTLDRVKGAGVYIIWHSGNPGRVIRIGQGDIADRLAIHREDQEILAYNSQGTLYVTWAVVQAHQQDGVEAYLAQKWQPLVGDRFPDVIPLAVNSPWS